MALDERLASRLGLGSNSLIREIQRDLVEGSASVSVVLRKARLAAKKLDLQEFLRWIEQEADGYRSGSVDDLPKYRSVSIEPKFFNPYRGWCPIIIQNDRLYELCHSGFLHQSVDEIEALVRSGDTLQYIYPKELCEILRTQMEFNFDIRGFCSSTQLGAVSNAVKNILLDWAVELERAGVLGEGMGFTRSDQSDAATVTQNIYAQSIGSVGDLRDNAKMSNRIGCAEISDHDIGDCIRQIRGMLPNLPDKVRGVVETELQKAERHRGSGQSAFARTCFSSIQKICESTATSMAAQGIAHFLKGML